MQVLRLLTPTPLVTPSGKYFSKKFTTEIARSKLYSIFACVVVIKGIMMLRVRGEEVWRNFTELITLAKLLIS